jgi:hypothetical protein
MSDRDDLVEKLLDTLADDDPAKPVVEALFNGGKVWEIPQSMYAGARKPRRWEVSEPQAPPDESAVITGEMRSDPCPTCGGSGEVWRFANCEGDEKATCPTCHGTGRKP